MVEPYLGVSEVVWVQEETENRGGWTYMRPRLQALFPDHRYSLCRQGAVGISGDRIRRRSQRRTGGHGARGARPAAQAATNEKE